MKSIIFETDAKRTIDTAMDNPWLARVASHGYKGAIVLVTRFGAIIVNKGDCPSASIGDGWTRENILRDDAPTFVPFPDGTSIVLENES